MRCLSSSESESDASSPTDSVDVDECVLVVPGQTRIQCPCAPSHTRSFFSFAIDNTDCTDARVARISDIADRRKHLVVEFICPDGSSYRMWMTMLSTVLSTGLPPEMMAPMELHGPLRILVHLLPSTTGNFCNSNSNSNNTPTMSSSSSGNAAAAIAAGLSKTILQSIDPSLTALDLSARLRKEWGIVVDVMEGVDPRAPLWTIADAQGRAEVIALVQPLTLPADL